MLRKINKPSSVGCEEHAMQSTQLILGRCGVRDSKPPINGNIRASIWFKASFMAVCLRESALRVSGLDHALPTKVTQT